jgi:ketosteroid isomerase-like protein
VQGRAAKDSVMSDLDTIEALTADDMFFRLDNSDPTQSRSELVAAAQSFRAAIAGVPHALVDNSENDDDMIVAILGVHQRRLDRGELNRGYCNVFRVNDGLARDGRSYWDAHR